MTQLNSMNRFVQFIVVSIALNAAGCKAREIPTDWKADCVGRQQLRFPSEAEIAANSVKMLLAEYKMGSAQPQFEFPDGQQAGWSSLLYMGQLYVSHPLTSAQHSDLADAAKKEMQRAQNWAHTTKKNPNENPLIFEALDVKPHDGIASRVNAAFETAIFVGDSLIRTSSGGFHTTWSEQRRFFDMYVAGVVPRPFGEVPVAPGVCLPYAFVRDDDDVGHSISTTYRLRKHPDVTVWLRDATAARIGKDQNPEKFTPISKSDFFWTTYKSFELKSVRSVWRDLYRNTALANSKGVESFVKIVRNDDAVDYGYLVATRGDPDAKEDTPDLMLYVIQDSKNAKAKGITPMEKDAFLEMAQTIAASVKRRPITAQ